MVKRVRFTMICTGLLLCALTAFGQPMETQDVQRKVLYETSTVKTFAVPCGVAVDSLSAFDSVYLQEKPPLIRQAEHVIAKGWLTITHNYPQQPLYDK